MSSLGRGLFRFVVRLEYIYVENDVFMVIKKSLFFINIFGDSMDVNK